MMKDCECHILFGRLHLTALLVPNWEKHDFVAEFAERVGDSTLWFCQKLISQYL